MIDRIEMKRNMDREIYQAPSCDVLNTTAQEPQWNLHMFTSIMKQERDQCFDGDEISKCVDGEGANCNNYRYLYKPIQSSKCVNYYDNKFSILDEVKKEFRVDECPQSSTTASYINRCSINDKILSENEELSKSLKTREIKQENSEKAFPYIKREEIGDKKKKIIVKTEMSEDHHILDNAGDTSVFYEVLITPQEIKPEMCSGVFKNRFNLLSHNNEHIKVEPPTLVGNEMKELYKCQCCDEYFNTCDLMTHVNDVHSNKNPKYEIHNKGKKPHPIGMNYKETEYKCDSCERVYKSKAALVSHTKKMHYEYGTMFECWCGEQFRTPIHLRSHEYRYHGDRIKNKNKDKFQCDSCRKIFKVKSRLVRHIKSVHYDYGKVFECWCGKQFRSPIHLSLHNNRQHSAKVKNKSNKQFQCDSCHKIFKLKSHIVRHIKNVHYGYGKVFECWCGKKFRSEIRLSVHSRRQHSEKIKKINNEQFQCDCCHIFFKTRCLLIEHIKSDHYNYGKIFECSCGKQFRSPIHLSLHNNGQQCPDVKNINSKQFQCDYCHNIFETKRLLVKHIKRIHYDYGKIFECWCGKQFRTPIYLRVHKYGTWH